MELDLDALLRLAEKPDCNMDELITLADAVKPLIERVRELENAMDYLDTVLPIDIGELLDAMEDQK